MVSWLMSAQEALLSAWDKIVAKDEHIVRNGSMLLVTLLVVLTPTRWFLRYRANVRERVRKVKEESFLFASVMIRVTDENEKKEESDKAPLSTFQNALALNPDFVQAHPTWKFVSLGEYFSSLRPRVLPEGVNLPVWIQEQIEAAFALFLTKAVGPHLGALLLPVLGTRSLQGRVQVLSNALASTLLLDDERHDEDDKPIEGGLQLDMFTLSAITNINQKMIASRMPPSGPNALDKMRNGEVGYEPGFIHGDTETPGSSSSSDKDQPPVTGVQVSNPFVLSRDWAITISAMEALQEQQMGTYDPEDRSYPEPTPVDERLLPDLYFGWGSAPCTHTKREVIQNRMLAVLLNRLAYNYYLYEEGVNLETHAIEPFHVKMDEKASPINNPADFIQALIKMGHKVELCPRVMITTFGKAMCVKEKDGTWSNVPLACFLDSGYVTRDGRSIKACQSHGGISMDVSGPLMGVDAAGKPRSCNIQHYLAIEGLCGWHSNHNADVPWLQAVSCCKPWTGDRAVHAVRLAALTSVNTNLLSAELKLPFGGYGLIGVCLDSAAFVEHVMEEKTSIHPLMSTGRFLVQAVRRMRKLQLALIKGQKENRTGSVSLGREIEDLSSLMAGISRLPTDLHAAPAYSYERLGRMRHCLPGGLPFQMNVESQEAIDDMLQETTEYQARLSKYEDRYK